MQPLTNGKGAHNVLGGVLERCSIDPVTGFYRTGRCDTGPDDHGVHTVCAVLTDSFLAYTASCGNDLSPLQAGDRWCLCADRWLEAYQAGVAPPVVLAATHSKTLEVIPIAILKSKAAA